MGEALVIEGSALSTLAFLRDDGLLFGFFNKISPYLLCSDFIN